MDDKLKVFWNLDVLVKMCRSKSDGPALRIEEEELNEKIQNYEIEIEEIKNQNEEETYDTSAEMADRNIEIITKKQLQTLKGLLKEKNKFLIICKEEEKALYTNISLLRENKLSLEKYILSMQERVNETTDYKVVDRYNALIAETTEKISALSDELDEQGMSYEKVQNDIQTVTDEIAELEDKIDKKKKLLAETQASLQNKENYVDKTKKEKNEKRIQEIETKIAKIRARIEEIKSDPRYIESIVKDIINNKEDIKNAIQPIASLVNIVIKQPYINVPADNTLEEELLKATQARDTFANEIDQKSYNILEAETPEKMRVEFLSERIAKWEIDLTELNKKVEDVDRDREYNYEEKNKSLYDMIQTMRNDLAEFQKAYDEIPETNLGAKATAKASVDEKRSDILEAEKIATAFRKDESEDIARATRIIKYECDAIHKNILMATQEIEDIKNRLSSKKSGLIDITTKNKDKDALKDLAQTVIDIKHRRQFPDTPIEIVKKLEEELGIDIQSQIDREYIERTSHIETKDYDEYTNRPVTNESPIEVIVTSDLNLNNEPIRGIKVINEAEITEKINEEEEEPQGIVEVSSPEESSKIVELIDNVNANEKEYEQKVEEIDTPAVPIVEITTEEPKITEETPDETTDITIEEPVVEEVIEQSEEGVEEAKVEEITVPEAPEAPEETDDESTSGITEPKVEEVSVIEESAIAEDVPTVEEPTVTEEQPTEEVPAIEEQPAIEVPIVEEQPAEETTIVEEPTNEEINIETPSESSVEDIVPVTESPIKLDIQEETSVEDDPVIEMSTSDEDIVVEEQSEITAEEPAIDITSEEIKMPSFEPAIPIEIPIVEEIPAIETTETEVPVEESPTAEEQPAIEPVQEEVQSNPFDGIEFKPQFEEKEITAPEETPITEEQQTNETSVQQEQVDNIVEQPIDNQDQPLDIDAMFNNEDKKEISTNDNLSINSIFHKTSENQNVKESVSSANLVNDFDQYINNLENKEE